MRWRMIEMIDAFLLLAWIRIKIWSKNKNHVILIDVYLCINQNTKIAVKTQSFGRAAG